MTSSSLWREALKKSTVPPSDLTGSEWADKYRVVPPGTSPEPGPWRTSRTPYLREPVDAATDRETEIVVMELSSQLGKSESLLNIIGYYADQEPSPQLMLQPTVEMAEAFSKERIEPMFQHSPGLRGKLEEGKDGRGTAKKSSTTIRMKHFPGGYLALVGANSPAGLASRPIRVLLCDEVDRYGETKEGDPLKLAIQRTQNFANRKIVLVSTPTIKDSSKIHEWFEKSDQRHFYVTCPHCGARHKLEWANVHWDKDKDDRGDPMTAKMFCPECGAQERGPYKPDPKMLESGVWIPENPGAAIRGYHCNALYSPWVNLHDLVEEWLSATHSDDKRGLMEFINLKLGEPFEQYDPEGGDWAGLMDRREPYPSDCLPEGVLCLTAGVDVQRDRIECSVYGWGIGRESWGICHRIFYGRPDDQQTWDQLDGLLSTNFRLKCGAEIPIRAAFIDSGDGMFTNEVYRYTRMRERRLIFSIKGRAGMAGRRVLEKLRNGRPHAVDRERLVVLRDMKLSRGRQEVVQIPAPACRIVFYESVDHGEAEDELQILPKASGQHRLDAPDGLEHLQNLPGPDVRHQLVLEIRDGVGGHLVPEARPFGRRPVRAHGEDSWKCFLKIFPKSRHRLFRQRCLPLPLQRIDAGS